MTDQELKRVRKLIKKANPKYKVLVHDYESINRMTDENAVLYIQRQDSIFDEVTKANWRGFNIRNARKRVLVITNRGENNGL